MLQQRKKRTAIFSFWKSLILVAVASLNLGLPVRGAEMPATPPLLLSCVLEGVSEKIQNTKIFTLSSGQAPKFHCVVTMTEQGKKYEVSLVGKETSDKNASAVSLANFSVGDGASGIATLEFPAIFQNGTYQFVFSLFKSQTNTLLSNEIMFTGTLKSPEQASILSAHADKERYVWVDPLAVTVTIMLPKNQKLAADTLFLDMTLQGKDDQSCQSLVKKQPVQNVEDTYQMVLPGEQGCTNALQISLTTSDGTVVDRKTLAVGLPEPEVKTPVVSFSKANLTNGSVFSVPKAVLIGLLATGVLVLALIGYFLVKKTKKRHF